MIERRATVVALGNMAMRGCALAARLLLSIYVARLLGFEALGVFGLLSGLAGMLPSILGFGVGYHVNRELLHADRQAGYRMLRDRLAMTLAVAAILWAAGGAAVAAGLAPVPPHLLTGALIVTLEVVAFDLHVGLLSLGRPVLANFLLFVRSASWAAPVVALGLLWPATRTLEALLGWWLAALVAQFALLPLLLRDLQPGVALRPPVAWIVLRRHAVAAPIVYLNDVALAGQLYLDRFVVAHQLGIAATGVYTLFFSVSQGIYLLTAAAVTQLSPRRMVAALGRGGLPAWRAATAREAARALAMGGMLAVAVAGTTLLVPLPVFDGFHRGAALFGVMIAGALVRPLADLAMGGLYLARADRTLAAINLAGTTASVLLGLAATAALGLIGIGITGVAMPVLLLAARLAALRRVLPRLAAAAAERQPQAAA